MQYNTRHFSKGVIGFLARTQTPADPMTKFLRVSGPQ